MHERISGAHACTRNKSILKIYCKNTQLFNRMEGIMKKKWIFISIALVICVVAFYQFFINKDDMVILANSNTLVSNKKISWGIKRADNNLQPDVGSQNKKLLDEYKGICLGNSEEKIVYLTFDEGYEAGYTSKILDVLKENNVKAAFFITGPYLNTETELIKRMVEEGHTVGNHTPKYVMSRKLNIIKI